MPKYRWEELDQTVKMIKDRLGLNEKKAPFATVVAGSGWGEVVKQKEFQELASVEFEELPIYQKTKLEGHARKWSLIKVSEGKYILLSSGREHIYQLPNCDDLSGPIALAYISKMLNIEELTLTCGCGSYTHQPGTILSLAAHINLMGVNPLQGVYAAKQNLVPMFPNQQEIWDVECRKSLNRCLTEQSLNVENGIYASLVGPTFESPAESLYYGGRIMPVMKKLELEAAALGMSMIPELMFGNALGLKIVGAGVVMNWLSGLVKDEIVQHKTGLEAIKPYYQQMAKGLANYLIERSSKH